VRPLACNWYYCAQSISKPKAACTLLRFSWAAASSNWLVSKCDVNHKVSRPFNLSEKDRATATGFNMHKNFGEYRTRSSEYDDRGQTNVHMHTHTLITILRSPVGGGVITVVVFGLHFMRSRNRVQIEVTVFLTNVHFTLPDATRL